jgi:hypothetical protein
MVAEPPRDNLLDDDDEDPLDSLLEEAPTSQTIKSVPRTSGMLRPSKPLTPPPPRDPDEDEVTRLDVGHAVVTPTPEPRNEDSKVAVIEDKPFDIDDVLDAPTNRAGRDVPPPRARRVSNPLPAVSAIAPPKASRRTPHQGLPMTPEMVERPRRPTPPRDPGQETPPLAELTPPPVDLPPPPGLPLSPPVETPPPMAPLAPEAMFPPVDPLGVPELPDMMDAAVAAPYAGGGSSMTDLNAHQLRPKGTKWWWILGSLAALFILVAVVSAVSSGPAAPTVASIEIVSIPAGATVTIDGQALPGVTPLSFAEARPGQTYELVVQLAKHERWTRQEPVAASARSVKVIASLKPILGKLTVHSTPSGADVFLNNRPVGRTPLVLANVDPFVDTRIEVRQRGHKPAVQSVTWPSQAPYTADLNVVLAPSR